MSPPLRIMREHQPCIEVEGRVADMIRWLLQEREDIEQADKGQVILHFGAGEVTGDTLKRNIQLVA